jgi:hypothetical protein
VLDRGRVCDRRPYSEVGRYSTESALINAGEEQAAMIPVPSGVHVWLVTGHTDICKGTV